MAVTRGSTRGRAAKASSGKSRFTDNLTWTADEKKYVQLVTPEDEWFELDMYFGKIKGQTKNGNDRYDWFVQRDADDDPISDKFDIKPKLRTLSVAVELEPVYEQKNGRKRIADFEIAEDDEGNPKVGMINQSHIFYGALYAYSEDFGPPHETVFQVRRDGGDQNTSYIFTPVGDAIELDEDVLTKIDLEEWVEEHMSEEHYELIEELPDDWVFDRFQQKKNESSRGGRSKSRTSTRSRRTRDDDGDDEETRPSRRSTRSKPEATKEDRFTRLRQKAEAKTLADEVDDNAEDDDSEGEED